MKAVLIVPSGTSSRINGIRIYRGEVDVRMSTLYFTIRRYLTDWSSEDPEQCLLLEEDERIVVLPHVAQRFPGEEQEIEIIHEEFYCSGETRAILIPEGLHLCFEDGALTFSEDEPGHEASTVVNAPFESKTTSPPVSEGIHCDGFCG